MKIFQSNFLYKIIFLNIIQKNYFYKFIHKKKMVFQSNFVFKNEFLKFYFKKKLFTKEEVLQSKKIHFLFSFY